MLLPGLGALRLSGTVSTSGSAVLGLLAVRRVTRSLAGLTLTRRMHLHAALGVLVRRCSASVLVMALAVVGACGPLALCLLLGPAPLG